MTEEARKIIEVMDMLNKCRDTPCYKCKQLNFKGEKACDIEDEIYQSAIDLIESLSEQLEQVTRERDAAIRDIDEAAPCFACIRFERNGGDCIGAHVCIDDILQDALGGKYADYYWQWRGVR